MDFSKFLNAHDEFEAMQQCQIILKRDCIEAIKHFANSEHNKQVYVFNLYGLKQSYSYIATFNTRPYFEDYRKGVYENEASVVGFGGDEYNPACHPFYTNFSEEYEDLCQILTHQQTILQYVTDQHTGHHFDMDSPEYKEAINRINTIDQSFFEMGTTVISDLKQELQTLEQTDSFCAYTYFHDVDIEFQINEALKTISKGKFERLFPGWIFKKNEVIDFEAFKAEFDQGRRELETFINSVTKENIFDYCEEYSELFIGKDYKAFSRSDHNKRIHYINSALQNLRPYSDIAIQYLIETHIPMVGPSAENSNELYYLGPFNGASKLIQNISTHVIQTNPTTNDSLEAALIKQIKILQLRFKNEIGRVPDSAIHLANALHYMYPNKYPKAEGLDDRLTNIEQFI